MHIKSKKLKYVLCGTCLLLSVSCFAVAPVIPAIIPAIIPIGSALLSVGIQMLRNLSRNNAGNDMSDDQSTTNDSNTSTINTPDDQVSTRHDNSPASSRPHSPIIYNTQNNLYFLYQHDDREIDTRLPDRPTFQLV